MENTYMMYRVCGSDETRTYSVEEYFTSKNRAEKFAYGVNIRGGWVSVEPVQMSKERYEEEK